MKCSLFLTYWLCTPLLWIYPLPIITVNEVFAYAPVVLFKISFSLRFSTFCRSPFYWCIELAFVVSFSACKFSAFPQSIKWTSFVMHVRIIKSAHEGIVNGSEILYWSFLQKSLKTKSLRHSVCRMQDVIAQLHVICNSILTCYRTRGMEQASMRSRLLRFVNQW